MFEQMNITPSFNFILQKGAKPKVLFCVALYDKTKQRFPLGINKDMLKEINQDCLANSLKNLIELILGAPGLKSLRKSMRVS